MDRANVSYAALSMNRDLGFNAQVYGFGAGVFFISYAACELPSNWMLLRFGARRWIARIMVTWGLVAAAMMFVRSPVTFYALRFVLGVAEAGFFPGVIYYLSLWFPQEMRSRAISRFYIALPLANVAMGLVAGSLLKLNGRLGLKGWQWLFLLEALPAMVLGVVVWKVLPDGPETASWLEEDERAWLLGRLAEDGVLGSERVGVWTVLRDGRVWLIGIYFLCMMAGFYALSFSAPAIVVAVTGWGTNGAGFLLAGMALVGAAAMLAMGRDSDRRGRKVPYIVAMCWVMAAGFLVAGVAHTAWVVLAGVAVATVSLYAMQGPALSLVTTFLSGPPAAMGIAAINTLSIVGGFVGPVWMGWAITRTGDFRWGLGMVSVSCAVAGCVVLGVRGRRVGGC